MFGHHWLRYWSFSPPLESIWIFTNRMRINRIFKLHTRLEKFNDIELNILIYNRKFIYARLLIGRGLNEKLWLHMTNGHI